jgi:uncharacterized protein
MRISTKKIIVNSLCLCILLGLCWGFIWEPSRLIEKSYDLKLPNWPAACADYRVSVASDIHAGAPYIGVEKIDRIVAMIQAQKPDLVLLPGDFVIQGVVGGDFIAPETLAKHLKPLLARTKVYAVLGNHDAWLDSQRVQLAFESVGIEVLEDRAVLITKNQCQFWLLGLSDYTEGKQHYDQAFSMVPVDMPTLAFTHNPDVFPDILKARFSLLIAGHTHGGQVALPLIGRPIVPSKYKQRYAIGHIEEAQRNLFVTPGIGTSILPVRFGVPPEISVLNLQSQ